MRKCLTTNCLRLLSSDSAGIYVYRENAGRNFQENVRQATDIRTTYCRMHVYENGGVGGVLDKDDVNSM